MYDKVWFVVKKNNLNFLQLTKDKLGIIHTNSECPLLNWIMDNIISWQSKLAYVPKNHQLINIIIQIRLLLSFLYLPKVTLLIEIIVKQKNYVFSSNLWNLNGTNFTDFVIFFITHILSNIFWIFVLKLGPSRALTMFWKLIWTALKSLTYKINEKSFKMCNNGYFLDCTQIQFRFGGFKLFLYIFFLNTEDMKNHFCKVKA